jgi:diaminohydroxyphosphoribosylaminopyrimidine deaminase/5-amino-6-(5-phosphoribosylamino)uracil reductase
MTHDDDARFMARALELAEQGRYGASPNPMVGAVVVDRAGTFAGEGCHRAWGREHAETAALTAASGRARGGTLYVTLEPCTHHGQTPPCADAVIAAGISRIVIATRDPNPAAGGGVERLRAAGLEVEVGLLGDRADRLNRRFRRWAVDRRPWVTLKAAVSLDGRIATHTGRSQWITSEPARRRALELREEHDAILVGVGTVLADDPRLTRRLGLNPVERFLRVVLDSHLRTPVTARIVAEDPSSTVLAHTADAPSLRRLALAESGVRLLEVAADDDGRVDLSAVLAALAAEPAAAVLVEGGSEVAGSFVDAGLVDEVVLMMAPILIGGRAAPAAVGGRGVTELADAARLSIERVTRRGDDLELVAVRPEEVDVHRAG